MCAFGVDGSARRCSGEPQRADRWATTADSVRGADDSSTVGCRVPCAPRECSSAGSRGSIGLRVNSTHPSAGAHVADNARAPSSAFSRATCVVDDTCRRQGRAAAQQTQNNKSQSERVPLCQNAKLRIVIFILPSYLLSRSLCEPPRLEGRFQSVMFPCLSRCLRK
jgi:hypothetical protein